MKHIKAFFASNYAFFLVVTSVFILASFIPFLFLIWQTPPGHIYLGTHNYEVDYSVYVSGITQGQQGKLTSINKFTAEEQTGTWVHGFFLWLGWLTGPLGISPVLAYHLARLLGGFMFALAIFVLVRQFFQKAGERNLAFLLAYAVSAFPHLGFVQGRLSLLWPYLPIWTGAEVMRRVTFLPHGLVRDALMLFLFAWWIKVLREGRVRFLPLALTAGFFLSLFSPLQQGMVWGFLGFGALLVFLREAKTKEFVRTRAVVKTMLLYLLFSLPSMLYIFQVYTVNPWKWIRQWETSQVHRFPLWEWAASTGPTLFLAGPAMVLALVRRGTARLLLLGFALATMLGIFGQFTRYFGITSFRFLGIPLHVAFGIFVADSLVESARLFRWRWLVPLAAVFLVILSLPTYVQSINDQMQKHNPQNTVFINVYPQEAWYEAMAWLGENTDIDDTVLSEFLTGNLIPVVGGNTTFVGHPISTIDFEQKLAQAQAFFSGEMSQDGARRFFVENRIEYVFWGPLEKGYGADPARYPFLEPVFENETAKVYKFKN